MESCWLTSPDHGTGPKSVVDVPLTHHWRKLVFFRQQGSVASDFLGGVDSMPPFPS